ncbi:phytyl ester synthase 2, chloroplastic [Cryptomeria japonica]|uniref:phytyl ester synthase 2, chloroplastic n=1 Tax=Cryptomeria japonica TaxID=3369 RepID=UPI0027DA4F80|nr:phytyl ester synthase 2, chloroplastic [Cryptomeria japonica]
MPSLYFSFLSHSIFTPPSVNHCLRLKPSINIYFRKITCELNSREPNFETNSSQITLLKPCKDNGNNGGPLFVYAPGMDCTGRGIRKQLSSLCSAGYDVRCIYIPHTDRSSWNEIVDTLVPLLEGECRYKAQNRHVTLMGESFGAVLALRIACAAPKLSSRMIVINSATNLKFSNPFVSAFARTGLLVTLPNYIYTLSQHVGLALMVKYDLVSNRGIGDIGPPIDSLPADCAAWRFSMLNDDAGLSEDDIRSIDIPTIVIVSAEDYVLSSLAEGARLQNLLENAKRVTLPQSGHAALLEDSIDLVAIMQANGFHTPNASISPTFQKDEVFLRRKKAVQDEVLDEMGYIVAPWRFLTSPLISGEENLPNPCLQPRRPVLFVGNHTLFGAYDTPILLYELFLRGFHARGLAHSGHWYTMIGSIFESFCERIYEALYSHGNS